jgi:phosphopantothenoylcysteine decarboxylase/phosphopantothenate--cysteine ligase
MKLLVTAGPTAEDIDEVRFITNRSSGMMGHAVAAEAARRGHAVTLVSGPVALECPPGVERVQVRSAAEMADAVLGRFDWCDAVVMAAAVADYRPRGAAAGKLKKSEDDLALELERTQDILAELGARKGAQVLVGFALETERGRESAEGKLASKNLDAIVLNGPATFGSEKISAELLEAGGGWQGPLELTKEGLAGRVLDLIEARARTREGTTGGQG